MILIIVHSYTKSKPTDNTKGRYNTRYNHITITKIYLIKQVLSLFAVAIMEQT